MKQAKRWKNKARPADEEGPIPEGPHSEERKRYSSMLRPAYQFEPIAEDPEDIILQSGCESFPDAI